MLDKMFWFLDEHIIWVHVLNFVVSTSLLLIPSRILAVVGLVIMIPLWIVEIVCIIYGIKKGYFNL